MIDAKSDAIRPNEQGLNVGSDEDLKSEKFLVDSNEILPVFWYNKCATF